MFEQFAILPGRGRVYATQSLLGLLPRVLDTMDIVDTGRAGYAGRCTLDEAITMQTAGRQPWPSGQSVGTHCQVCALVMKPGEPTHISASNFAHYHKRQPDQFGHGLLATI